MNAKLFKLVPCTPEEIKADPKQAFVVVWNLKPDGFIVSPESKIITPDWARHITEGSAAIHNIDNLIKQTLKPSSSVPPNCPICHGQRELNGSGGYICHFCGREMSV